MTKIELKFISFLVGAFLLLTNLAGAQNYPTQPIKLIVPVPPGGTSDLVGRMMANAASSELGQQIVIDNRAGAAGSVGTAIGAKAPADGYTLIQCSIGNCAINPSLYEKVGYDLFKDLTPVILLGKSINVLTVNNESGIRSVADLVEKAKKNPLAYASSGVGASNHLSGELLKKMASVDLTHIPYKGSGPAITDLLGGQIPIFFDNEPSILPFIKNGKVRALAVTGKTRSTNLPDVPTMEELGYSGFVIEPWYAFIAPANTPKNRINLLNQVFDRVLKTNTVRQNMLGMGITPVGGTPEQMGVFMRSEYEKWGELIRAQGIKGD